SSAHFAKPFRKIFVSPAKNLVFLHNFNKLSTALLHHIAGAPQPALRGLYKRSVRRGKIFYVSSAGRAQVAVHPDAVAALGIQSLAVPEAGGVLRTVPVADQHIEARVPVPVQ